VAAPSFVNFGTVVATSTTAAPAYNATTPQRGDMAFLVVGSNSTAAGSAPAGWLPTGLGVLTANSISLQAWWRICVGGESGTQSVTGLTSGTKGAAWVQVYRPVMGGTLDVTFTSGLDTDTTSAAYSASGSSWAALLDDRIVAFDLSNTTVGTYSGSASVPTVTHAGATVTGSTSRFTGVTGTSTVNYNSTDAAVSASGTGAPTFTATMTTATSAHGAGPTIFARITETMPPKAFGRTLTRTAVGRAGNY